MLYRRILHDAEQRGDVLDEVLLNAVLPLDISLDGILEALLAFVVEEQSSQSLPGRDGIDVANAPHNGDDVQWCRTRTHTHSAVDALQRLNERASTAAAAFVERSPRIQSMHFAYTELLLPIILREMGTTQFPGDDDSSSSRHTCRPM